MTKQEFLRNTSKLSDEQVRLFDPKFWLLSVNDGHHSGWLIENLNFHISDHRLNSICIWRWGPCLSVWIWMAMENWTRRSSTSWWPRQKSRKNSIFVKEIHCFDCLMGMGRWLKRLYYNNCVYFDIFLYKDNLFGFLEQWMKLFSNDFVLVQWTYFLKIWITYSKVLWFWF